MTDPVRPAPAYNVAAAREAHRRAMMSFDPSVAPSERWDRAADAAVAAALGHSVDAATAVEVKGANK